MKNIIWCEVTCSRCGCVAGMSGYYSPKRIKLLKETTKDWVEDKEYRVLCPECVERLNINNDR